MADKNYSRLFERLAKLGDDQNISEINHLWKGARFNVKISHESGWLHIKNEETKKSRRVRLGEVYRFSNSVTKK